MAKSSDAPKSYKAGTDLPPAAQNLKGHQVTVFRAAFENARKEYPNTKAGVSKAYATAIAAGEKAPTTAPKGKGK